MASIEEVEDMTVPPIGTSKDDNGVETGAISEDPSPPAGGSNASIKVARSESEGGSRISLSSLLSTRSAYAVPITQDTSAGSAAGSLKSDATECSTTAKRPASPSLSQSKADGATAPTTAPSSNTNPAGQYCYLELLDRLLLTYAAGTMGNAKQQTSSAGSVPRPTEQREASSLPRLQNSAPERRSRSRTQRLPSASPAGSSGSPHNADRASKSKVTMGKIGVCALDGKARSKPSRNILTRLQSIGEFEVILFGDKAILDEAVENWPLCDYLISFFSDGFPLEKAIAYVKLRKPFCVNDLPMQRLLWDRRICVRMLDHLGVPTPTRIEVNRDGGPRLDSESLVDQVQRKSGLKVAGPGSPPSENVKNVQLIDDGDALLVDGVTLRKPFVEKPVSGEDHNIRIYFPKSKDGGGGRKLFRKIGNKSSEWDKNLIIPRAVTEEGSSYLYEQFLDVDNAEDVKAYTVGPEFCHAETRKSPVVDGLVRRNTHGKEIRYITALSKEESIMAAKISEGFGQRICGFDLLRAQGKSYVIDVNGWSFVKDNDEYYNRCAGILKQMFLTEKEKRESVKSSRPDPAAETATEPTAKLGGHRNTLKGLFKAPSFSKLRGIHHTGLKPPEATVESAKTTPKLTPQRPEKDESSVLSPIPSASEGHLPLGAETPHVDANATASMDRINSEEAPPPAAKHSWKLKGMVAVIRHADRTPKQKFKFTFHTQPFIDLLKGHQEEVLLKGEPALNSVLDAVNQAIEEGEEDREKLNLLKISLEKKGAWTGTKVQIKPMFRKRKPEEIASKLASEVGTEGKQEREGSVESAVSEETLNRIRTGRSDSLAGMTLSRFSAVENDLVLDKLQLIIKWGGEPTHSARYQSQDLGENMRNDLLLMNREALSDVRVFTSSEPRVSTSAQIFAASFLDQKDVPDSFISVRKDLLDDSNAAKDVMDKVKKKLKLLLRAGENAPPQFAWPPNTPEPAVVVKRVAELMRFHRRVMRHNFSKLTSSATASLSALNDSGESPGDGTPPTKPAQGQAPSMADIQPRWCTGEDPELFKERWEKLFAEFADPEKNDPSKISELYDTMKYDALHNRHFLEWVFTPSQSILDELAAGNENISSSQDGSEKKATDQPSGEQAFRSPRPSLANSRRESNSGVPPADKSTWMNFRRKSVLGAPISPTPAMEQTESYFKLFSGSGQTRAKQDHRLEFLRELYRYSKILFDFICPQEYGISDGEKLEIGLLTSLPLLKEIVADLEEMQASERAKSFIYFTKESHVYTLLNAILEGGIRTKIARNAIPELDYLSQIVFELYEAADPAAASFAYSIRITLTPGCHTSDPLDLQLDARHSIGCAPRRSLTAHTEYGAMLETLRAKFNTVKLPRSFLAVNLSEKHGWEGNEVAAKEEVKEAAENEEEEKPCVADEERGRGLA